MVPKSIHYGHCKVALSNPECTRHASVVSDFPMEINKLKAPSIQIQSEHGTLDQGIKIEIGWCLKLE